MRIQHLYSARALLLLCFAIVAIWALVPTASSLTVAESAHASYVLSDGSFWESFTNSLLVAACSIALCLPLSVFLAWHLQRLPSPLRALLPLGLVPFLLGPTAAAFAFKIIITDWTGAQAILNQHDQASILLLAILWNVVHYLPAFAFFLERIIARIPEGARDMLRLYAARPYETFRTLVPHHLQATVAVLVFLGLCLIVNDASVGGVLFVPSEGTDTQTLSYWLARTYLRLAAHTPESAAQLTLRPSLFASVLTGIAAAFGAFLSRHALRFGARCGSVCPFLFRQTRVRSLCAFTAFALCLLPFVFVARYAAVPSAELIWDVSKIAARCAFIAAGISVAIWGLAFALFWVARFRQVSAIDIPRATVALCLVYAMPPFGLAVISQYWQARTASQVAVAGLSVSLFVFFTPLLVAFIILMLWSIADAELHLLRVYGASSEELARSSVWPRFRSDAIVLAVILFGLCLCEGPISAMYSGWCPSFSELLSVRVAGRGTSFREAAALVFAMAASMGAFAFGAARLLRAPHRRIEASAL